MASSGASVDQPTTEIQADALKRKSNDVGWEYGILVDRKCLDKVKCVLCGKVISGGIYRLKEHIRNISGNVSACSKASVEDRAKCKNAIMEAKAKKRGKKLEEIVSRSQVNIPQGSEQPSEEDDSLQELGARKGPRFLGSMDKYVSRITPEDSINVVKQVRQQNINDALFKERTLAVHKYVAKWVYEAGIPFNAIDNESFRLCVEAIGQFGPSYVPPSQYMLREPLLRSEVENTKSMLKKQEEEWALHGCSIMTDAWFDRKRRSIMNLCLNCKIGTTFLSSKESSDEAHTAQHIFEYVDACIEQVGAQNIVQVVTDNATNNMAAAKLMKAKRPQIFWTSCATHTINLMLESIGKLPKYKRVIEQAKTLTIFIYAHHKTLALMRSFTKKRDIVRPGVTRFASSFLTLQSLVEKKSQLKAMFSSDMWENCKWAKTTKGKAAYAIVMRMGFWNGVTTCLKVFAPLVKVLRLVDGDRKPSMGFLYGELKQAKEDIKEALQNCQTNYQPIFDIIDAKMKDRLDGPLHLTAYLLNPYYIFKDPNIRYDDDVSNGVFSCTEAFSGFDNMILQNQLINIDLKKYMDRVGSFGRPLAAVGCEKNDDNYDPVSWWTLYGTGTPNLQTMAIRILSLTTSSSGCERNWSTVEGIHSKKRNRLDVNRLNNLVYVQFNAKLKNKQKRKEKDFDVLLDVDSCADNAQEWIVEGVSEEDEEANIHLGHTSEMIDEVLGGDDILQQRRSVRLRQLHEDDFASEDDEEVEEENFDDDFNFLPDEDRVIENYGEEEIDPNN